MANTGSNQAVATMFKDATRTLQNTQTTLGSTAGIISKAHSSFGERSLSENKIQLIKAQTKILQLKDLWEPVKELALACPKTSAPCSVPDYSRNSLVKRNMARQHMVFPPMESQNKSTLI